MWIVGILFHILCASNAIYIPAQVEHINERINMIDDLMSSTLMVFANEPHGEKAESNTEILNGNIPFFGNLHVSFPGKRHTIVFMGMS